MKQPKVIVAGLLAVLIWGAIPAAVKLTLTSISVAQYLLLRFAIGLVIMAPWLLGALKKKSAVSPLWWVALTLDLGANYYFQSLAMQGLPASWYIVIFALNPIFALLILRIPMNRKILVSVAIATVGTLLFTQAGDFEVAVRTWDIVCIVIGMLTWVIYTYIVSKLHKAFSDVEITAITQGLSFVAVAILWANFGFPFAPLSGNGLGGVLFLGICTPAAYFLFSYALRHMPTFGVASQYMEPVFGVIFAYWIFGETLSVLQILGALGIVCATANLSTDNPA